MQCKVHGNSWIFTLMTIHRLFLVGNLNNDNGKTGNGLFSGENKAYEIIELGNVASNQAVYNIAESLA